MDRHDWLRKSEFHRRLDPLLVSCLRKLLLNVTNHVIIVELNNFFLNKKNKTVATASCERGGVIYTRAIDQRIDGPTDSVTYRTACIPIDNFLNIISSFFWLFSTLPPHQK